MKKFTILLALVILVAMPIFAEHVPPETARKVASTFLKNNGAKASQLTDLSKAASFPNLYIFTADEGFVVMSADDCVKPILGYSLTNKFVAEGMPENISSWLQGYSDEIQYAIENQAKASSEVAKQWKALADGESNVAKTTIIVDALVQTRWDQIAPFNNNCPSGCATGCVATAMAQVMKYWNYPEIGIGSHSYSHNTYGTLSVDFYNTSYEWSNMTNTYNSSSSQAQKEAVATLMYHCGVSVNMEYGSSSSANTSSVVAALKNYFNYATTMQYKKKSEYNNSQWIAMLKEELDAEPPRPLQYRGSDTGGMGGHSFVCDGYDSDNKFHFNWGWGEWCDGFYALDDMEPGVGGIGAGNGVYRNGQAAIFGIQPATISTVSAPTNLTATPIQEIGRRDASLAWEVASGAISYQVFRDDRLIYTTESGEVSNYLDEHVPYGTHLYYVRSVDTEGNLSLPSNYASLVFTFSGPTNFSAQVGDEGILLSWSAAERAIYYNVYCNNVRIGTHITNELTYTDTRTIAGTLTYFVKAVDELEDESDTSETQQIIVGYQTPLVDTLSAYHSGDEASLSWNSPQWCYPQTASSTITYGSGQFNGSVGYGGDYHMYWGHRYLSTDLNTHVGKTIYRVSFYVNTLGYYKLFIYNGTKAVTIGDNTYEAPVDSIASQTLNATRTGWFNIDLDSPIAIDNTKDLWVIIYDPEYKPMPGAYCSFTGHNRGNYASTNIGAMTHYNSVAWLIRTYLTDGTYTYNLYQDGTKIAENISETTYSNVSLNNNAPNLFTVKTNYYGGETSNSNKVGLAKGDVSLSTLNLASNDKMTITENSTLTVSGTLTNTNANNLIIEDGGQLITSSDDVAATVKKTITGHEPNDLSGWKFIASPVSTAINPINAGLITDTLGSDISEGQSASYDLYYFDESQDLPWKNYRNESFCLENGKGYLYANNNTIDLAFAGTLYNGNGQVTLAYNDGPFKGWNLVGNPFICDATIDRPFFIINGRNLKASTGLIPPCTGVMVQAAAVDTTHNTIDYTHIDGNVTFTKVNPSSATLLPNQLQITVAQQVVSRDGISTLRQAQGSEAIDNAIVSFNKGNLLEKFIFDADLAKLYIPQNGKDFAIVTSEGIGEMPLNFSAAEDGTYTLTINPEGVEMNYLHLIDNLTGNDVDLLASPDYTFEAKTTDYASRFRLVFASDCEEADDDNENFAFLNDGNIIVYKEGTIQIIDITGRIVLSGDAMNRVSTSRMSTGVYVLRLITANGVKSQKIIID